MIKRKKVIYAEAGQILDVQGANGSIIQGTKYGDLINVSDSTNVSINGLGDNDIITATNTTGRIDGGAGSDVIFANLFSGTILGGSGDNNIDAFDFKGTITTGTGADILTVTNGTALNISSGSGDDAITINGGAGKINAGAGADLLQVSNVTGPLTIDLGKDSHGDLLIIDATTEQYAQITIKNFNEATDTLIWNNLDQIA